ncbi:MAG TPA: DUF192 domain-containing protein [Sphingomonadales bacterium]|nr:DUF192 domain-containing protein [Sphingomonadales bacterium]
MRRFLASFVLALALLAGAPPLPSFAGETGKPQSLALSELRIETATGVLAFEVEVARTPDEWGVGLMHRMAMPENHGMLFVYPGLRPITMWMKNTYIPLDMLFILPDGTVSSIAENTTPLSLELVSSRAPALAVLELNAGIVKKLGIREGDLVRHAALGNLGPGGTP